MYAEQQPGSVIWIEHLLDGDVYTRVKLISERQPSSMEICRVCHRGELSLHAHLVQHGLLDDIVWAVTRCTKCCALTVFQYHVEAGHMQLPEVKPCDE